MNKLILWDLFGGGQNSIYNTVKEYNLPIDVYTFDITEPQHEKQFKVDLSVLDIIVKLKDYPKPDIIVASPLCQSFSCALAVKGGTVGWKKLDNKSIQLRTLNEIKECLTLNKYMKNWKADVMRQRAILGWNCIFNTLRIIGHYQPKYWYIENPKNSLMWNYIKYNYRLNAINNFADYSAYGFLTQKPTNFLSNINLNLKTGGYEKPKKIKEHNKVYLVYKDGRKIEWVNCRSEMIKRLNEASMDKVQKNKKQKANDGSSCQIKEASVASAIPHLLLKDILEQFIKGEK